MALSTFFFGAFIIGDTFTDPGGWKAAGLVAAWAVPLAGLTALSWFCPGWAAYVFAVLSAAVIGVSIWFALDPQAWRSFENQHGPIRAVITFILVAAMAVLGLQADGRGRGPAARGRLDPGHRVQPGQLPGLCLAVHRERGPGYHRDSLPDLRSAGGTASAARPHRYRSLGTTEGSMTETSRAKWRSPLRPELAAVPGGRSLRARTQRATLNRPRVRRDSALSRLRLIRSGRSPLPDALRPARVAASVPPRCPALRSPAETGKRWLTVGRAGTGRRLQERIRE